MSETLLIVAANLYFVRNSFMCTRYNYFDGLQMHFFSKLPTDFGISEDERTAAQEWAPFVGMDNRI